VLKLMLVAVLAVVLIALVALMVSVISSAIERRPVKPSADASNEQWETYYRRMADSARRSGDTHSVSTYESMAETYRRLQE
jgi:hypothetical protein